MIPNIFVRSGTEDRDEVLKKSLLNTDIFSTLIFREAKIERQTDKDLIQLDSIPEIELDNIILNVAKTKNVVTTAVQGRAGTVKEYVSDGDYILRCRGVIVTDKRSVAPVEDATTLHFMLSLGQPLEIAGSFAEIFNIHTVVVKDFEVNEMLGTRNQYNIRITMETDTPIELNLVSSQV